MVVAIVVRRISKDDIAKVKKESPGDAAILEVWNESVDAANKISKAIDKCKKNSVMMALRICEALLEEDDPGLITASHRAFIEYQLMLRQIEGAQEAMKKMEQQKMQGVA